jgi:hypothetical protein
MLVLNVDTRENKEGVDKIGCQCEFTGHETVGVMQLSYGH